MYGSQSSRKDHMSCYLHPSYLNMSIKEMQIFICIQTGGMVKQLNYWLISTKLFVLLVRRDNLELITIIYKYIIDFEVYFLECLKLLAPVTKTRIKPILLDTCTAPVSYLFIFNIINKWLIELVLYNKLMSQQLANTYYTYA